MVCLESCLISESCFSASFNTCYIPVYNISSLSVSKKEETCSIDIEMNVSTPMEYVSMEKQTIAKMAN